MALAASAAAALAVPQPALQPNAAEAGQLQFIHIPKNAGTSIEDYGKAHDHRWGASQEWPAGHTPLCALSFQLGMDSEQQSTVDGGGDPWHVPPRTWKENGAQPYTMETFCVVRNPYTRIVSEFIYNQQFHRAGPGADCGVDPLNAWVHDVLDKPALRELSETTPLPAAAGTWDCHLLPSWVYTSDCNNVLKFETLEAEFGQLMADKLGASGATLPVNNAASCTMLASSLDDRARELVRTVYARDFELFGYSTDVPEDAIGFLDSAEVAQIDRELARSGRAAGAASGESRGSRGPDEADALKVSPS